MGMEAAGGAAGGEATNPCKSAMDGLQRHRETGRQRDRETGRQRDRETERQRDRVTEGQRDRKTEIQRDRSSREGVWSHIGALLGPSLSVFGSRGAKEKEHFEALSKCSFFCGGPRRLRGCLQRRDRETE